MLAVNFVLDSYSHSFIGNVLLYLISFMFFLQGDLLYNEYIVYNVDQIRMRYVVQVNFNFKR